MRAAASTPPPGLPPTSRRMRMELTLYNTLTRRKERFEPGDPERVTMYVCGPTVYSYAHIGNARPAVVFDVLARLLRRHWPLVYARNVTDVDDKINAAAAEAGVPIGEITSRYTEAYHADMAALGVAAPDIEPYATRHIGEIVDMIGRLIAAGCAYEADGHVLFRVSAFPEYGRLSGRDPAELLAGARVEVASYKEDPGDFVLWKPSPPEIVGWDSPWGRGRPGWHIECSSMIEKHLGETIDIHGGGQDLIFPHHENEIAQSTCAHGGAPFCRYWLHNGFLSIDDDKMSKSLGNVLLVRDLLQHAPGEAVRLALLTAHYRQPLNWSTELLTDARRKLDRLYGALRDAGPLDGSAEPDPGVVEALADDLNTPKALAELFGLARRVNAAADRAERRRLASVLRASADLLGIAQAAPDEWFERAAGQASIDETAIETLVEQRNAARAARDFAEADRIRDELAALGVTLEDGPEGTRWRLAEPA
jgi:cysteinyl-tRNA synthetase